MEPCKVAAPAQQNDEALHIIARYRRLRSELNETAQMAACAIEDFQGSAMDAIKAGLVKPAIPVPAGWLHWVITGRRVG